MIRVIVSIIAAIVFIPCAFAFFKSGDEVVKAVAIVVGAGTAALWILTTAVFSITVIDPGYRGVEVKFGTVYEQTLPNGFQFKHPASNVVHYYTKRQVIDMRNGEVATSEGVRAITSDKTSIWVDVAFPYRLNGEYANWIHENIGGIEKYKKELLIPAAREAVKSAASKYSWDEVAITKKEDFVMSVREQFVQSVKSDLQGSGLEEKDTAKVFAFNPVQLRNIKLPNKLQNSINERQASKEELKRQKTLTQIAREEAERRRNVGTGIAKMFEELPNGYTAKEMSDILHAIADVRRAKALGAAIERDQVTWGLFTGGNTVNPGANVK